MELEQKIMKKKAPKTLKEKNKRPKKAKKDQEGQKRGRKRKATTKDKDKVKDRKKKSKKSKKDKNTSKRRSTKQRRKGGIYMPPKAPTNYLLFQNDMRAAIQKASPNSKFKEVSRLVADAWHNATEAQRKHYSDMAEKARKERQSLIDRIPEPPKPPKNEFLLFSDKRRPELRKLHPDMTLVPMQKKLGHEWSSLSEEERNPYVEEAHLRRTQFEKDNSEFYTKYPKYGEQSLESLLKQV